MDSENFEAQPYYVGNTNLEEVQSSSEDINILLLGETGVGKSTFINSFVSYYQHKNFENAENEAIITLIPSTFTMYDENDVELVVKIGDDKNEFLEPGQSATQATKSYVIPFEDKPRIRLIDTPGIGDTRGIEHDTKNFDNILSYISQFEHLNAICILLKPNNTRLSVVFEFCIKELLTHLEKSASKNIIFVFTNSRSTFYRPGETKPILAKLLKGVEENPPFVKIPFEKNNTFCLDNEAFRFLIACKNGVNFTEMEKQNFIVSWDISVNECERMIEYISNPNLKPHQVKDTISINEVRKNILQLSKPLACINEYIEDNISILNSYKKKIEVCEKSKEEYEETLYIPTINLKRTELSQPVTVCTDPGCCHVVNIGERKMYDYVKRCHEPCYLKHVPKEIVGCADIRDCAAMDEDTGDCEHCGCPYNFHMHVYYMTERYEDKIEDKNVKDMINTTNSRKVTLENHKASVEKRIQEFTDECAQVTKSIAKFAQFIKIYSITPYNDAYEQYLKYLIKQEERLGDDKDEDRLSSLEKMLAQYKQEVKIIEEALQMPASEDKVMNISEIYNDINVLFALPHVGEYLKDMYETQSHIIKQEQGALEFHYSKNLKFNKFINAAKNILKKII